LRRRVEYKTGKVWWYHDVEPGDVGLRTNQKTKKHDKLINALETK